MLWVEQSGSNKI